MPQREDKNLFFVLSFILDKFLISSIEIPDIFSRLILVSLNFKVTCLYMSFVHSKPHNNVLNALSNTHVRWVTCPPTKQLSVLPRVWMVAPALRRTNAAAKKATLAPVARRVSHTVWWRMLLSGGSDLLTTLHLQTSL